MYKRHRILKNYNKKNYLQKGNYSMNDAMESPFLSPLHATIHIMN